jgi:hypothetical protein
MTRPRNILLIPPETGYTGPRMNPEQYLKASGLAKLR